jgi:hypothetical protein
MNQFGFHRDDSFQEIPRVMRVQDRRALTITILAISVSNSRNEMAVNIRNTASLMISG